MITLKSIKQKVSIEAKFLNKNINDHLLNKLIKIMIGKCSNEHGYFLNVNRLISVGNNSIMYSNSLIIFDVVYEALTLKPEIGDVISGTVCMVFQHGIFVNVNNKLKVLIPATSLKSYVFKDNSFTSQDKIITNGIEMCIVIVMIKYEKKEFSCIGDLHTAETYIQPTRSIQSEEVQSDSDESTDSSVDSDSTADSDSASDSASESEAESESESAAESDVESVYSNI